MSLTNLEKSNTSIRIFKGRGSSVRVERLEWLLFHVSKGDKVMFVWDLKLLQDDSNFPRVATKLVRVDDQRLKGRHGST